MGREADSEPQEAETWDESGPSAPIVSEQTRSSQFYWKYFLLIHWMKFLRTKKIKGFAWFATSDGCGPDLEGPGPQRRH